MHCKEIFLKSRYTKFDYEALGLCKAEFIHSSAQWPLQIDCSGEGGRCYKHISKSAQPKTILKQLIGNYFLVLSHQSVFWGKVSLIPLVSEMLKIIIELWGGREETLKKNKTTEWHQRCKDVTCFKKERIFKYMNYRVNSQTLTSL